MLKINPVFDAYKDFGDLVLDVMPVPAWSPDGRALGVITGPPESRQGWRIDLESGTKGPLFDIGRLRAAIKEATGVTPEGQGVPFSQMSFTGPNSIAFVLGADQLSLELDTYKANRARRPPGRDTLRGISADARGTPRIFRLSVPLGDLINASEVPSPDREWLLSVQNHNICIRSTYDGRAVELTGDGTAEAEWNFDWTNPMPAGVGIETPVTNWSPDSEKIAVYKIDHRGVPQWTQPHYLKRLEDTVFRPAPRAGGTLETYKLYVLDVAGRAPVEIRLGDTRDTYPVHAAWLPDCLGLVIFQMSRDCRQVNVLMADPVTGAVRPIFQELGATFIRIHHDIYFSRKLGLTLTPDGRHILWLSERDGFKHIYQYDLEGKLVAQLTSGAWAVDAVVQVIGGHVYFTAHSDGARPYDLHFCRVPMSGGKLQQLTQAPGKHSVILAPNGKAFLDTHSAPDRPHRMEVRTLDGRCLNDSVSQADISKLKQVGYTPAEEFTVKAADGTTDLWGVMYKPHDFDFDRKYPLIEYVYGGPQMAVVEHGFTVGGLLAPEAQRLATLGCICVMLDGRGTPERSKAFHDVVYKDWAGSLVADHTAAIRQLTQRYPFIDDQRVGVTGHSWGGYASTRLLFDAPEVYKCAVSSSPGYDPYSSVLYECYLGTPQNSPEAYRAANVIARASKMRGALMIACGTSDTLCWMDVIKMSESLIRADKEHEVVPLPAQGHGYDSQHTEYFQRKRVAFLARHLRERGTASDRDVRNQVGSPVVPVSPQAED
jgi:dipeptidyl-peptidase-4